MRDPGASGRSEDSAAELSLFRRHGGAAEQGQAGGSHGKFGADWVGTADYGYAEESGSRRLSRGDPLFQRRAEAAPAGQGRDGALHARGGARLRRRAQAKSRLDIILSAARVFRVIVSVPHAGTPTGRLERQREREVRA